MVDRNDAVDALRNFFSLQNDAYTVGEIADAIPTVGLEELREKIESGSPGIRVSSESRIPREEAYFLVYDSSSIEVLMEALENLGSSVPLREAWRPKAREITMPTWIFDALEKEVSRSRPRSRPFDSISDFLYTAGLELSGGGGKFAASPRRESVDGVADTEHPRKDVETSSDDPLVRALLQLD